MSKVLSRAIGQGRVMFYLDDANFSKGKGDEISLCNHGFCDYRDNCDIRETVLRDTDELGVFAPITGCVEFAHTEDNGTLEFE